MLTQRLEAVSILGPGNTLPGYHHQIKTSKLMLVNSETLTYHALYSIAINGKSAVLFRHGQAQSSILQRVGPGQHQEAAVHRAQALAKNPTVFVGF